MSREQFETAYSELMGTPASVLKNLRDGDEYRETEGHRMQVAWLMWQAASKASEQQLAAVVAENAGLKAASSCLVSEYMMNKGADNEFIACITPSKKTIGTGGVWDMWRHLDMALDATPATEAVLAEVRAKGVEMFAKNAEVAEQGNGLMKAIARRAIKFAAQLRQGAAL